MAGAAPLNEDFRDMLHSLSGAGAEFVVVEAHALSVHGVPRATGDLDVFVRPSPRTRSGCSRRCAATGPLSRSTG